MGLGGDVCVLETLGGLALGGGGVGPRRPVGDGCCSQLKGVLEGKLGLTFLTWRTGDSDLQYF